MVLKTSGCGEVKTNWGFVFPTLSMRDTEKTLISQDLLQFRLVLGFFCGIEVLLRVGAAIN